MGGVAASRLGLWMFDLSVMQQMQVSVHSYVLNSHLCYISTTMCGWPHCFIGYFVDSDQV